MMKTQNEQNKKPKGTHNFQLPKPPRPSAEEELMSKECVAFLTLPRWPAIVHDVEAGYILNVSTEGIGILVAEDHLEPLAHLSEGDCKRFATVTLKKLAQDPEWMHRATEILYASRRSSRAAAKGGAL